MDWSLLEQIRTGWALITKAPLAAIALVVLGYLIATWYLSGRMAERDGQIARYRVTLGLDKPSQGNLIELTNEEMRAKALATAAALRQFNIEFRNLQQNAVIAAKDDKDKAERSARLMREQSDEFDRKFKADSNLVDNELRRRLGPAAVASIVGVPPSLFSASDKAALGIVGIMPSGSGMSAMFAGTLADGIEQMGLLLPAK